MDRPSTAAAVLPSQQPIEAGPSEEPGTTSVPVSNALVVSLQEQLAGMRGENLDLTKRLLVVEEELAQRNKPRARPPTPPSALVPARVLAAALAELEAGLAASAEDAQGYRDALAASEERGACTSHALEEAQRREAALQAEVRHCSRRPPLPWPSSRHARTTSTVAAERSTPGTRGRSGRWPV